MWCDQPSAQTSATTASRHARPLSAAPERGRHAEVRTERIRIAAAADVLGWRRNRLPRAARPRRPSAVAGRVAAGLSLAADRAKTVGRVVHVPHELPPADHLPNETLAARKRQRGHRRDLFDERAGQDPREVEHRRDAGVEESATPPAHRVLVGAEVFETGRLRPIPEPERVLARRRKRLDIERAGMVGEARLDLVLDLASQRRHRKSRRLGCRRIALPRLPILRVEGVLAAFRRPVGLHEQAGRRADLAIERVHAEAGLVASSAGGLEECAVRHEERIRLPTQTPRLDERRELEPHLAFRRIDAAQRWARMLVEPRFEQRSHRSVASQVFDRESRLAKLRRKRATVEQDQGDPLAVIGPARKPLAAFEQEHATPPRAIRSGERPDVERQLVRQHEDRIGVAVQSGAP